MSEKIKGFKESEIGLIPLSLFYERKEIEFQNGFPCGNWNDKGIGIIQLRPFNINEYGQLDLSVMKSIGTDKNIEKYLIKRNDVIFNNTNSESLVGKTSVWNDSEKGYVLSNHMMVFTLKVDAKNREK